MNNEQEQPPLYSGEERPLPIPTPITYMEQGCIACNREKMLECDETLSPPKLHYTPVMPACGKRKSEEAEPPFRFRNVRARLEAEQEEIQERNLLTAARQALEIDLDVIPSTPKGRLGRTYKISENRCSMRSLMDICREAWHAHLARYTWKDKGTGRGSVCCLLRTRLFAYGGARLSYGG